MYTSPEDAPIIKQYTIMNPIRLLMNDKIRKAREIRNPPPKIIVLNPTLPANFTPNERTEFVIIPKIGNTICIVEIVTLSSFAFINAPT